MKYLTLSLILLGAVLSAPLSATRLKDLVTIKGVRDNPIIGYGLVIGLDGTGDDGGDITNTSLKKMFQKLGLDPKKEISSKNTAAVIVTAKINSFSRIGQKVDVIISSIGEANSLAGGTLLVTPLKGGDGKVYAVANGPISIGGLQQGKRMPTTAVIPGGASIEKEVNINFNNKKALRLALKHPDFTTAARVEKVINQELGGRFANAMDASTIDIIVPTHYRRRIVPLVALIENYDVIPDSSSKVVINERTGTIVAGGDLSLRPVAIAHGDLNIEVKGEGGAGAAGGDLEKEALFYIDKKAKLKDLVKALNALGVAPDDLINIFQALKKNGALTADIEII